MKNFFWIFLILIFILSVTFGNGRDNRDNNLDITSLSVNFYKSDATFTVTYDLGSFQKLYMIIIGSKPLVPKIESVFSNFNYEIVKMDQYKAVLRVKNITRFDNGYYFYDTGTRFGQGIPELDIYLPGYSEPKKYSNVYLFNWENPYMDNFSIYNFLKYDLGIKWKGDLKIFKALDNKSIIGIEDINNKKEKLFLITLDKNTKTSQLDVNGVTYNLLVVSNNDQYYIYSPYIYSIPNIFYRD